jgi:putative pyoverdin transport system ATP-binding/permease protein
MIGLLSYLFKACRREILIVVCLGVLGGASSAAIIAVVNSVLHGRTTWALLAGAFSLAVLLKLASSLVSNILLLHMTQDCTLGLCDEICRKVIAAPLRQIEELGASRVLASLTDDVTMLSAAISEVPHLIVNTAVLVGCAAYLTWLSWHAGIVMLAIVLFGSICYRLFLIRAQKAFETARDGRDVLFRHFRSLTEGIKELKLNRNRRESFFDEDLVPAVAHLRRYGVVAVRHHIVASTWSQSVFYLLLALLLFVLTPNGIITREALTAYVFVALFATGPLLAVTAALPALSRGQTALERIQRLGKTLGNSHAAATPVEVPKNALCIEFEQVQFVYGDTGKGGGFSLGPLNFTLEPGELVFVTGGNGSGKSTFVKVLTGLYRPVAGNIRLSGRVIDGANNESYRELFSAVYSDFFLFQRLPGLISTELQRDAHEYLVSLKLDEKVQIIGNTLSTTALSQGQRRRLALLMAYMEDRPIYVLDEWAADQDPGFRDVFYTRLLPELKRKGKTVVVVTHDDRYFHLGDRLVNLDYGKIRNHSVNPSFTVTVDANP